MHLLIVLVFQVHLLEQDQPSSVPAPNEPSAPTDPGAAEGTEKRKGGWPKVLNQITVKGIEAASLIYEVGAFEPVVQPGTYQGQNVISSSCFPVLEIASSSTCSVENLAK